MVRCGPGGPEPGATAHGEGMKLLSSLTNRIFLASAIVTLLATGSTVYLVSERVIRQPEAELQRGLVEAALAGTAIVVVLLSAILSSAVSRTITHPLATITNAMREMATTGDLTRKISLRPSNPWDDEDSRRLAATFNTLTDSIARFQREATQRERLSSLGELSTVIAHEIRNPLMIIKAQLRTLRQERATPAEVQEALDDIDGEVVRLNRIVNDVLDFARPIRFDLAAADLQAICRDAVEAAHSGGLEPAIHVTADPASCRIVTDAERLRTALVNIFMNAGHAVAAAHRVPASSPSTDVAVDLAPPAIEVSIARRPGGHAGIVVRDTGIGINAQDLPRVFDPYFTTKATGTGLGLTIAKNIIEGLGGSIAVASQPGAGTEISIELPNRPADPSTSSWGSSA